MSNASKMRIYVMGLYSQIVRRNAFERVGCNALGTDNKLNLNQKE